MKTMQLVPAMDEGGVERGVVEMNRAIAAAGWENVVVSSGGRLAAQIEADGGRHITARVKSKNPFDCLARAAELRRILAAEKPDVVCAHSRVPAWLFKIANRSLGIKWITFAHGANSVSPYSRVMTYGDLTVTPSNFVAGHLKKAYGIADRKIRVIPRAIEKERFDTENLDRAFMEEKRREWGLEGRFTVMGLGRITRLKGYDRLIEATAQVAVKIPDVKLVIVGEAEASRKDVEAELRAQTERLGLEERVVFAGNQRKVAECLSLANVVVQSNTEKPEAFGRSMAEALAMGRPVVAKAFGGALDIVRDGIDGILVEDREFAEAIVKVAGMKFGDLRKSALERFSFERMTQKSLSVYKEVAKWQENS